MRETGMRVQALLLFGLMAWIGFGATATYLIDPAGGQLGWLVASFVLLGFNGGVVFYGLRVARMISGMRVESAQVTVDTWPYVITMLEDLERIEPECAEMIEVVRLEMEQYLRVQRRTAGGRSLTLRELLAQLRSKP